MINHCPKCHAQLPDGARFCPHCMAQFDTKQQIKPEKKKSKPLKIILYTVVPIILVFAIVFTCVNVNKHKPICTFDNFCKATPQVSQKMDIDDLWDSNNFVDTHYFEEQKITQYTADTYLGNAYLSIFFYNKGEEVYAYFCDVDKQNKDNAESILKCITQSVCNYYFTDIDEVFDDEVKYPKSTLDKSYDTFFTDLLKRTDEYNADIKSGTKITTKYIAMTDNNQIVVYYVIERNTNGNIVYDLAVDIERQ